MNIVRILWAILLPAVVAFAFSREMEYEQTANRLGVILEKNPGRVTVVYQSPLYMPIVLALLAATLFIALGFKAGGAQLMGLLLEAMILLSIYYVVLLLALPLLRRVVSARACATLWLLPAFLYWLPHMWHNYPVMPKVVLRVPPQWAEILGLVWVIGFVAVLALYGGIMNPTSALLTGMEISGGTIAAYYITGFPVDCIHAVATWLFLWFGSEPMLEKLDRVKVKYGLVE